MPHHTPRPSSTSSRLKRRPRFIQPAAERIAGIALGQVIVAGLRAAWEAIVG